jgi:radical SAM protein with 4Fe4S-binding SPASM domain
MAVVSDHCVRPEKQGRRSACSEESTSLAEGLGSRLRPQQVTWEMTRACEWNATPTRLARRLAEQDRREFSTAEAFHLIEEIMNLHVPLLALSGGDPLLRPDLLPIIEFAARHSVRTSLTLLPTPLVKLEILDELKSCGSMRASFWLHGSTAALHDAAAAMPGSFRRTTQAVGWCHEIELPIQINTIMTKKNFHDVDLMIEFLTRLDAILWNVFFLVPSGPEQVQDILNAEQHEEVFARLYDASTRVHFQIKTTEAPHYQRYLIEQRVRESRGRISLAEAIASSKRGINEGNWFVFVNHHGEVFPSRFLPLAAGNVTVQALADIYRHSELFTSLRDSSRLKGKCGRCPVRTACGGSRARAYAICGDLFAEDPLCAYQP